MQNFRRFTDLQIVEIPDSAKLVVLIGPNGCGKSSIFDGIVKWHRENTGLNQSGDSEYYHRESQPGTVKINLHNGVHPQRNSLYVRTAYRNEADFSSQRIETQANPVEQPSFYRLIEDDKTVSENYQRLLLDSVGSLYSEESKKKPGEEIVEELIGAIRTSMINIFGDLSLNTIVKPLSSGRRGGAFYFSKGSVASYHYKNLSGGEKAAFDLILDIHLKKKFFPDALYCIDEIESHLHTGVQGTILQEIFSILPNNSQLWVSTHSLGVLRAAQSLEAGIPGSVCLINFDGVNLDVPSMILPSGLDRASWEKMLSITLDDLSDRVAPEFIVVCEGSSVGSRRKDFDADVYEKILRTHNPEIVFVSGGSSDQVAKTGNSLRGVLERVLPKTKVIALADRDDKSTEEVARFEGIVLTKRNIESYLFADDVIEALLEREGRPHLYSSALEIKDKAIKSSALRGYPTDDLKSVAGEIYNGLKELLDLRQSGSNKDAFMRYTLSTLIVPGMKTYNELKSDIVDKVRTA